MTFKPTPPTAMSQTSKVWVERSLPGGDEEGGSEEIQVHNFVTQPAMVRAEVGRTINTGNYESIHIRVGVEIPAYAEELPEALEYASSVAGDFIQREEAAIRDALKGEG